MFLTWNIKIIKPKIYYITYFTALKKSPISPLCWVLPNQYEQFLGVADGLGTDVRWVFKSTSPGGTIQVLQPTKERDYAKVKQ